MVSQQVDFSLDAQYITEDDVKLIVTKCGFISDDTMIQHYELKNASNDKMLGFLADYLNLKVTLTSNYEQKVLCLFIKAVPRTNAAKASFIAESQLYNKELKYYELINGDMKVLGLKPWSAKFVTALNDLIVLDDLYALKYRMRNKYTKFDEQHTLQALNTLARFHASTLIFEEKKSRELQRPYRVEEDHGEHLTDGIFTETSPWFSQCRDGSLEIVKLFSKYSQDKERLTVIESRWREVFNSVLTLSDPPCEDRTVISHRDLWNNNIMFHYERMEDGSAAQAPDDCVLVDFQMVCCQPPAADVMLLLNCNLESQFRKKNLMYFLNYYYDELKTILLKYDINIDNIIKRANFMSSAKKYNQWGLVIYASFVQVIWPEDKVLLEFFNDSERFQAVSKEKITFMKNIMETSEDYKKTLIGIFEEIIDEYILNK